MNQEPYIIIQLKENRQQAKQELKNNDCIKYVYFKTPFQYRYIGVYSESQAKKIYKHIINQNKDLYGCVVSIEGLY